MKLTLNLIKDNLKYKTKVIKTDNKLEQGVKELIAFFSYGGDYVVGEESEINIHFQGSVYLAKSAFKSLCLMIVNLVGVRPITIEKQVNQHGFNFNAVGEYSKFLKTPEALRNEFYDDKTHYLVPLGNEYIQAFSNGVTGSYTIYDSELVQYSNHSIRFVQDKNQNIAFIYPSMDGGAIQITLEDTLEILGQLNPVELQEIFNRILDNRFVR